jgi:hypothetical protein
LTSRRNWLSRRSLISVWSLMFYDTTWSSLLTDIELRTPSLNSVLHALEGFQDIEYNNSQLSDNENLSSSHKRLTIQMNITLML